MSIQHAGRGLSRRQFLRIAATTAAGAALWSLGARNGWAANVTTIDTGNIGYRENEADIIVVGSGIAGLFAAVKAHDAGARVIMVSKGGIGTSGQTPFARGIFSYDPATASMSLDEFAEAVNVSAIGTSNRVFTRQMAEHSMARVEELREWGFFDTRLYGNVFRRPIEERGITTLERVMVTHLVKEDGRMAGVAGFGLDDSNVHILRGKSVILCTGAGGFKPNGFPICDLTHDGTVMAYDIGAKVTGKEWNDGHTGSAENPAACYDGWERVLEGLPSTTSVEIHHDLGVGENYMAYMQGNPIQRTHPDMRGDSISGGPYVPDEFLRSGPPSGGSPGGGPSGNGGPPEGMAPPMEFITSFFSSARTGMSSMAVMGGASAGMSIHKSEGLVPMDETCRSNIPGLYAAGDALGSYMAGAIYTQVGSSMAGSAVQGAIAAEAAAEYVRDMAMPVISSSRISVIREEMLAPLNRDEGYGPAWVTQTLQGIMIPNFVLYIKKGCILQAALAYMEELRDRHVPMLRAADLHELRLAHETRNMIVSAEMKLRASLMRTESRCSHYRLDYPDVDYSNWQAWINLYKGSDGTMKLERQPFESWPD
jgi:succinate dehydrogenase/fumarate reductase flavoprotein subunit